MEGRLIETLPNAKFIVELESSHQVRANLSGKMRRHYIQVLLGDWVKVELSPYDLERGRLIFRYKKEPVAA